VWLHDGLKVMANKKDTKRFNLVLPNDLVKRVQKIADEEHTSVVEILRRFIKIGLLAVEIQKKPGAALILREGDDEKQILLL